jgi:hypothetical protein
MIKVRWIDNIPEDACLEGKLWYQTQQSDPQTAWNNLLRAVRQSIPIIKKV